MSSTYLSKQKSFYSSLFNELHDNNYYLLHMIRKFAFKTKNKQYDK